MEGRGSLASVGGGGPGPAWLWHQRALWPWLSHSHVKPVLLSLKWAALSVIVPKTNRRVSVRFTEDHSASFTLQMGGLE